MEELETKIVWFKKPWRFPDINYFHLLNRIRVAKHTPQDIELLRTRVKAYEDRKKQLKLAEEEKKKRDMDEENPGEEGMPMVVSIDQLRPISLYALNRDVDRENFIELEKIKGNAVNYKAYDRFFKQSYKKKRREIVQEDNYIPVDDPPNAEDYSAYLDKGIPRDLLIKIGAQVRLTVNLDPVLGLVNGSVGLVTKFEQEGVTVLFENGFSRSQVSSPHPPTIEILIQHP